VERFILHAYRRLVCHFAASEEQTNNAEAPFVLICTAGRQREREGVKQGGREREEGWRRQAVFLLTNYLNTLRLLLHGNGSGSVLQHIHTHILAYTVFLLATFCFNHKIRTFYPLRHNQCMYVSV